MKNLVLVFFVILSLVFVGSFGYQAYLSNKYTLPNDNEINATASSILFPQKILKEQSLKDLVPVNSNQVKFNGWIPSWASSAGIQSFEENASQFETISPVIYTLDENGIIATNKIGLEKIKQIAGENVKVVPTISSFNANGLQIKLKDEKSFTDFLLNEIEQNNYDGIDLNYEEIFLSDKDNFYSHLKNLKAGLTPMGKTLSVTVLSKWGDFNYGFAPQTREVQDYSEVAKYADQVRIMAYDYTSKGSINAGGIAPADWVEQVLTYATNRIPENKIVLGIPLYGYFWGNGETGARALNYRQIEEIINFNTSPDKFFSTKEKEGALKYIGPTGKTFFGYYASPEAVQTRINLAAKYGVKSVVFWRLGDDPL